VTGFDVLRFLMDHDVMITPGTLRNWAIGELIPLPGEARCEKGSWYGLGLTVDYPPETGEEALAAYLLLKNLTLEVLKYVRIVGRYIERKRIEELRDVLDEELQLLIYKSATAVYLKPHAMVYYAFEWLAAKGIPQTGALNDTRSILMQLTGRDNFSHHMQDLLDPEKAAREQEEANAADPWIGKFMKESPNKEDPKEA